MIQSCFRINRTPFQLSFDELKPVAMLMARWICPKFTSVREYTFPNEDFRGVCLDNRCITFGPTWDYTYYYLANGVISSSGKHSYFIDPHLYISILIQKGYISYTSKFLKTIYLY